MRYFPVTDKNRTTFRSQKVHVKCIGVSMRSTSLTVLCTAVLIASPPFVGKGNAYYDDVHFALTYYMARKSGYTAIQSYRVASACSATDWDPDTEPVQGKNQAWLLLSPFEGAAQNPRWKFHAMRNEREFDSVLGKSENGALADGGVFKQREALWEGALNVTKNPGVFLHSFQDEDPHRGYGTKWGHWPMMPGCVAEYKAAGLAIGGTTDWVSYRPDDVIALTSRCWGYLQKFMDKNSPHQLWRPYDEAEYAPLVRTLARINPFPPPVSTELQRQLYIQYYAKYNGVGHTIWQNLVNPTELSAIGNQLGVSLSPKELEQQRKGPEVHLAVDAVNAALKAAGFKDVLLGSHYHYDLDSDGALENEYMKDDWVLTGSLQVTLNAPEPVTVTLKMPASATGKEYILPVLTPIKLSPNKPYKWDNLPLGDLILSMERADGKVVRGEVLLDRQMNTYTVSLKGPAAKGTGPLWVSKGPHIYGISAQGPMEAGKFLAPFSGSASGGSYADPGGGASGSATFTGVRNSYREGDLVELTATASNMITSGRAIDCANGESKFFGARDPWETPASSVSVSFTFKPRPFKERVHIGFESKPTNSKAYYSCGFRATWLFEPAAKGVTAPDSPAGSTEPVEIKRTDPPRNPILPKKESEEIKPPIGEPEKPKTETGTAGAALPEFKGTPLELKDWDAHGDNGGSAKFVDGAMVLDASAASGGEAWSFSKTPLKGDFDVSFDYELPKWNPKGDNVLTLDLYMSIDPALDADDSIQVSLVSSGESHQILVKSSRQKSGDDPLASTLGTGPAKDGRIRVIRSGGNWSFHHWHDKKWQAIGTLKYDITPETYIGMSLVQQESPGAAQAKVKVLKNGVGQVQTEFDKLFCAQPTFPFRFLTSHLVPIIG